MTLQALMRKTPLSLAFPRLFGRANDFCMKRAMMINSDQSEERVAVNDV